MALPSVPLAQIPEEIAQLVDVYTTIRPQTVVEIGVAHGGSLWYWLKHAIPGATVIAIDQGQEYWKPPDPDFDPSIWQEWVRPDVDFHYLEGDSQTSAMQYDVAKLVNHRIDFLFIDADHSYHGVKKDWQLYFPMVANAKGVIALHDIIPAKPHIQVDKWWNVVKTMYPGVYIEITTNQGWGGIGIVSFSGVMEPLL